MRSLCPLNILNKILRLRYTSLRMTLRVYILLRMTLDIIVGARFLIEISRSASEERPQSGNLIKMYERPVRGRPLGRDMTERKRRNVIKQRY